MLKLWGQEVSKKREENKVVQELLHSRYDYYVAKPEYSAFYKTKLGSICSKEKIKELYFTGLSSGCCVHFSAAGAAMRGIQPYLVSDASGAPNEKRHKDNLARFKELLGPVVSTKKLLVHLIEPKSLNIGSSY